MAEDYPFNLKGSKWRSQGYGGDTYKSQEIVLEQGIVIVEITHHGLGEIEARVTPTGSILDALFGTEQSIEMEGQESNVVIFQVDETAEDALRPGKHRLEVDSSGRWECKLIQPNLGQGNTPLTDSDDDENDDIGEVEPGLYITGPHLPTRRPILAEVLHKGPGGLYAIAYSVDGTHWCVIHGEEGQFYGEQLLTEIRPGKEYMLWIHAEGKWNITLSEGY